ncbi:hypothetical protein CDG79_02115 [Nostoc sp. 'Peltigera membranacea cyanobiont' 232]|nr:hypothetical protein CDG79_02115 [Nostoc sp. 'Peltigera membranacea cyanobiont' 232]
MKVVLLLRVLQERKCPIVVASEAKQSQPLGLLRFARNDGFWIIYFLEHSKWERQIKNKGNAVY